MALKRIEVLEQSAKGKAAAGADELEAQSLAGSLGFHVDVLTLPARRSERVRLARVLSYKEWSAERISRVLRCSEKTVRRWLSGHNAR